MAHVAKGLSIWLSPKLTCSYRNSLRQIIRNNASHITDFEPHVTLLTLPRASLNNVDEVVDGIKKIAKDLGPFSVNLTKLTNG